MNATDLSEKEVRTLIANNVIWGDILEGVFSWAVAHDGPLRRYQKPLFANFRFHALNDSEKVEFAMNYGFTKMLFSDGKSDYWQDRRTEWNFLPVIETQGNNSFQSFNLHTVSKEQISEVSSKDLLSGVYVMRVSQCVHFEN